MVRSIFALLALAGLASAERLSPRQGTVNDETKPAVYITALNKNVSATSGTGAVSAAGTLEPFGGIGVGCGINWAEGKSYGGGLQSGSESFGLGGGFTITEETMTIGLGIGVNGPLSFNTTVDYEASTNGSASVIFTSTNDIKCQETTVNGLKGFKCTSL
ncbi:uncharacterized protein ColSpa_03557 [Colletotrichum spaethianum]|uniref:Uncharacterized protein n=1 Tax=Colletotrichum spaethianum TaxID=700344 RepID=A0AA37L7D4_9PEZI|nr:uncharacterized protein ColSpa_03557 [Colletotrichum spaethianum]GKT43376.1 hypothetical protein ColSpa_03557 [Colletotrichum spaethianum]